MAMLAAFAALVGQQIASGIASSNEAKYNASIYEQQAELIKRQKSLEGYQYDRAKRQFLGKAITRTAKAGFMFTGSPLVAAIDSLTQMELDKSIGQYNLEVQRRYSLSAAEEMRRRGRIAFTQGFTNAFSTILQGGFDYGMRSGTLNPGSSGTLQSRLQGRTSTFGGETIRF